MKRLKSFALAMAFGIYALIPSTSKAQGNPLKNIPITEASGYFQNATFSIDNFYVKNNAVYVSSTLRADGGVVIPDVESLVKIEAASCDMLTLQIISSTLPPSYVEMSKDNFYIGDFTVTATKKNNDNRLKNALCSIAELNNSNASLNSIVANLKAAIRAY